MSARKRLEDDLPEEFLVVDAWSGDDKSRGSRKQKHDIRSRRHYSRCRSKEDCDVHHRKPTEVEIDEFVETLKLANVKDDYNGNRSSSRYCKTDKRTLEKDNYRCDSSKQHGNHGRSYRRSDDNYPRSSCRPRNETDYRTPYHRVNVSYERGMIKKTICISRESCEDREVHFDEERFDSSNQVNDRLVFMSPNNRNVVERSFDFGTKKESIHERHYSKEEEDLRYSLLINRRENSVEYSRTVNELQYNSISEGHHEMANRRMSESPKEFIHSRSRNRKRGSSNISESQPRTSSSHNDRRSHNYSPRRMHDHLVRYRSRSPRHKESSPEIYYPTRNERDLMEKIVYTDTNYQTTEFSNNEAGPHFVAQPYHPQYYPQPLYQSYGNSEVYAEQPQMIMQEPMSNYEVLDDLHFPKSLQAVSPSTIPSPPPPPKLTEADGSTPFFQCYKTPKLEAGGRSIDVKKSGRIDHDITKLLQNKNVILSRLLESSINAGETPLSHHLKKDIIAMCELKIAQLYRKRMGGMGCFVPDTIPKKYTINRSPIVFWKCLSLDYNKPPEQKVWRYTSTDHTFRLVSGLKAEKSTYIDYPYYEKDLELHDRTKTNIVSEKNRSVFTVNDSSSLPTVVNSNINNYCEVGQYYCNEQSSSDVNVSENLNYGPVNYGVQDVYQDIALNYNNQNINQENVGAWYPTNYNTCSNYVRQYDFNSMSHNLCTTYSNPGPTVSNNVKNYSKHSNKRNLITVPTNLNSVKLNKEEGIQELDNAEKNVSFTSKQKEEESKNIVLELLNNKNANIPGQNVPTMTSETEAQIEKKGIRLEPPSQVVVKTSGKQGIRLEPPTQVVVKTSGKQGIRLEPPTQVVVKTFGKRKRGKKKNKNGVNHCPSVVGVPKFPQHRGENQLFNNQSGGNISVIGLLSDNPISETVAGVHKKVVSANSGGVNDQHPSQHFSGAVVQSEGVIQQLGDGKFNVVREDPISNEMKTDSEPSKTWEPSNISPADMEENKKDSEIYFLNSAARSHIRFYQNRDRKLRNLFKITKLSGNNKGHLKIVHGVLYRKVNDELKIILPERAEYVCNYLIRLFVNCTPERILATLKKYFTPIKNEEHLLEFIERLINQWNTKNFESGGVKKMSAEAPKIMPTSGTWYMFQEYLYNEVLIGIEPPVESEGNSSHFRFAYKSEETVHDDSNKLTENLSQVSGSKKSQIQRKPFVDQRDIETIGKYSDCSMGISNVEIDIDSGTSKMIVNDGRINFSDPINHKGTVTDLTSQEAKPETIYDSNLLCNSEIMQCPNYEMNQAEVFYSDPDLMNTDELDNFGNIFSDHPINDEEDWEAPLANHALINSPYFNDNSGTFQFSDLKKKIQKVQSVSRFLLPIFEAMNVFEKKVGNSYIMKGGLLCKICKGDSNNEIKIAVPADCEEEVVSIVHSISDPHASHEMTRYILKKYFSQISLATQLINLVISMCLKCNQGR